LQQWVARVGVKPCRNQKQIRFESDQVIERTLRDINNSNAGRERRDGVIVDICKRFRTTPGIRGELMNRAESNSLIMCDDRLGPVPVMSIKIPDANPFGAFFQRVERGDSNVAEITEPHRAISRGVMPRWAHQAKGAVATQSETCCVDCCTRRMPRINPNVWIKRGVEVKMFPRVHDAFEMLTRMRAQQLRVRRGGRLLPFPIRMSML